MKRSILFTLSLFVSLFISVVAKGVNISVTITQPTCQQCNGVITAVGSNGTAPYQYSINGGVTWVVSGTFSSRCAGTVTVMVKDALNNQASQTVTLVNPSPLIFNATGTNCSTPTSCDGAITVSVSGGTPPYNFTLTGSLGPIPFVFPTTTNLCTGTYTLTITDSTNCPAHLGNSTGATQAIISIGSGGGSSSPLTLNAFGSMGSCINYCNYLNANVSGGIPPYQYNFGTGWTSSTSSTCLTGIGSVMSFNVCARDAVGSTICQTVTVNWPLVSWFVQANVTPAYCGSCNGSITALYTYPGTYYSLSPGPSWQTSPTFNNLCPGTYTLSVSPPPASGRCLQMATFVVPDQPGNIGVTTSVTNVSCYGNCNGAVSITATAGGTLEYSIDGGNNWYTSNTFTNLCAGTYTAQVRNVPLTCTGSATFTVTQPPAINPIVTSTSPTCFGNCNGSISVAISPTSSYQYSINGGVTYQASSVFTNRCPGTYTITVRQISSLCTTNVVTTIAQPAQLTAAPGSVTNTSCSASANGTLSVVATGGTGTLSYNWLPGNPTGDGTPTISNLSAGTYTCVITDANGCTRNFIGTVGITPSASVQITASDTTTCFGGSDGAASVTVSGGATPYTYNWLPGNPPGDGTSSVTGLSAGTWTCVVTAGHPACTTSQTVVVAQPAPVTASMNATSHVTCFGLQDGQAQVTASGGNGTFTYLWSPAGGNGTQADSLAAGMYTCTVTDMSGCTGMQTVLITQPLPVSASLDTSTNVTCYGLLDGSATLIAAGGNGPYSYLWSPAGGNSALADSLGAGTYLCTVTDANGCAGTHSVVIAEPSLLIAALDTSINVTCFNLQNGSASVSAVGGTGPYAYSWSPYGGANSTAVALGSGNYSCTISDINGCSTTQSVTITQPSLISTAVLNSTTPNCAFDSTGSISLAVSGGTPSYAYNWLPSVSNSSSAVNLPAGNYSCVVSDSSGCTDTISVQLTQPSPVNMVVESVSTADCFGSATGDANVVAFGGAGAPFNYNWQPTGGNSGIAIGLPAGTYTCTATDSLGCSDSVVVVIAEPNPLAASLTTTDENCFMCNGTANAAATGGNGGYIYYWQGIPDSAFADSLCNGNYELIVTDSLGCADTLQFIINNVITLHIDSVTSVGTSIWQNNGTASLFATGSGTLNYQWDANAGNQTTATAINLAPGNYCVVISDSAGCTDSICVNVALITGLTSLASHEFNVYPNPFTNELTVSGYGYCQLQMIDLQGRVVQDFGSRHLNGGTSLRISEDVSSGSYFLRITFNGATSNIKVVKQ